MPSSTELIRATLASAAIITLGLSGKITPDALERLIVVVLIGQAIPGLAVLATRKKPTQ